MNEEELRKVEEYTKQINEELEAEKTKTRQMARNQTSLFNTLSDENLVKWQLDLREDMDRIYHLLRGHVVKQDEEGNFVYAEPDDPDLKPFNEFGVQLIMNIMSFYLNRNTLLSNYREEVINWKVYDFGIILSDLIHNRYESMMMTLPGLDKNNPEHRERIKDHLKEKIKIYPMIVQELVDTIHSAYLRAYKGLERDSLRTARTVHQSDTLGMPSQQAFQSQRKFKFWNPTTWVKH